MPAPAFSLRTRILLYSSTLLIVLIAAMLFLVDYQASVFVNERLSSDIRRAVARVPITEAERLERLYESAALVASFPNLKALLDTDLLTIRDFLAEYQAANGRTELLIVLDPDGNVVARTDTADPEEIPDAQSRWLSPTFKIGRSVGTLKRGNKVFLASVAPIEIGGAAYGFVLAGAEIDGAYAKGISDDTGEDIVLIGDRVFGSTVPAVPWTSVADLKLSHDVGDGPSNVILNGETFAAATVPLGPGGDSGITTVVLRSRDDAIAPYRSIQAGLLILGLIVAVVGVLGSAFLARTITGPLEMLKAGTERIGSGELDFRFNPGRGDEIDALTRSFNHMLDQRQALESQMRQAQKMDAIGRLAGGVAHDFNNLLTVIIGRMEILETRISPNNPMRADIDLVRETADRAASLTAQLLAFSRRQVLQPTVVAVNSLVMDLDRMLRRLIGEDIAIVTKLDFAAGNVRADRGQIEQVVLNLVVNARDAMKRGGGRIEIETANARVEENSKSRYGRVAAGNYVMLSVADNGSGMTGDVQAHLFEPFFTTKEAGEGTGLGLSTAFGIVAQSGGHIAVESTPGHGSVFKVFLPRVESHVEEALPVLVQANKRGSETVLLVEDEEIVRTLVQEILELSGYTVLNARSPSEAIRILEGGTLIDIMLTDVVMPDMPGTELALYATSIHPEMRILFMSGYPEHIADVGKLGHSFIKKPFTIANLTSKIREVLEAPRVEPRIIRITRDGP